MIEAVNPDELREGRLQRLRILIGHHARAQAERDYLDEFKRSKLAILMREFERAGIETVAAQEREARAHPDYLQLLEGLRAAVEEAERLRWELKLEEMRFEAWRTTQANQRQEKARYGT